MLAKRYGIAEPLPLAQWRSFPSGMRELYLGGNSQMERWNAVDTPFHPPFHLGKWSDGMEQMSRSIPSFHPIISQSLSTFFRRPRRAPVARSPAQRFSAK